MECLPKKLIVSSGDIDLSEMMGPKVYGMTQCQVQLVKLQWKSSAVNPSIIQTSSNQPINNFLPILTVTSSIPQLYEASGIYDNFL